MPELETFGFSDEPEVSSVTIIEEPIPGTDDDPALLKAVIEEMTKAAAECMDAAEAEGYRQARRAAEERLKAITTGSGFSEGQWAELAKAYIEMGADFKGRLAELGGISNDSYHTLTQELSAMHQAGKKPKANKKKGDKKKEEKPKQEDGGPEPSPEDRWVHIQEHVKNLGMDAWALYDELKYEAPLTHEQVSHVLREANARVEDGQADIENHHTPPPIPKPPAACLPPASATPPTAAPPTSTAGVSSAVIWDEQLKKAIDLETGEVVSVAYFLELVGIPGLPEKPDRELAAKILDVMHTHYIDPAARYRAQAEKMAAPLDARAKQMEAFFGAYLDLCGAEFLPKFGARAAVEKQGKFSAKTLDLLTGSISWKKDGGITQTDSGKYYGWLQRMQERLQELNGLCREGNDEAKEELKYLQDTYGLKIETKAVASNDKIKDLSADKLPDGWEVLPANEFATRTIK